MTQNHNDPFELICRLNIELTKAAISNFEVNLMALHKDLATAKDIDRVRQLQGEIKFLNSVIGRMQAALKSPPPAIQTLY